MSSPAKDMRSSGRLTFGRRTLIILGVGIPVLAFLAVLAWASFISDGAPGGIAVNESVAEVSQERKAAPNFRLELPGGGTLSIEGLRGRVVMLDFWASWCQPCRDEAPVLAQVYREYRGRDVEFVGINLWDNPGDAELFLQEQGHEYPNGIDAEGKIAISYGVRGIPEKFFITSDGLIARKFTGPMNPDLLRRILDALLSEP
jgi:cytochrome c biogenesis protein CcmG/thiol:disulfide interchange protein DsbE